MDEYNRQNENSDERRDEPQGEASRDQWQNGTSNMPPYPQGGQWQNSPYGPNGGQPGWQGNQPYGQPPVRRNGQALASMIFGILALVSCCIPFIQFPLAVAAIVLVILSKKKQPLTGFAIAGLVLGIISIVISIAMTFYWGYAISMMNTPEFWEMYNEMMEMYQ